MKCPNCGIDEPIKGEYCIHCGSNLELTPAYRSEEDSRAAPGYTAAATDCTIIAQKIESLRNMLTGDMSERAGGIDDCLFRARNAMEDAAERCKAV